MGDMVAVQVRRREWRLPLVLDFEGLTLRLGLRQAETIWDAAIRDGLYIDATGEYRRMIPLIDHE